MDEATRLVSELQQKLAELDHNVSQYRRAMVSEFTKYAEDVLCDLPSDVVETVSKTIATDMKNYKSLNPTGADIIESCETGTSARSTNSENTSTSYSTDLAIPKAHHRSEVEVDSPIRSPHERELEFQGLFTPSYLPLLDSTSRNERRSSYGQFSPILDKGKEREMEGSGVDASTDTRSLASSPEFRRPSTPRRRNTDELSVLSASSDHSDGPVRRSALRRTSNSSKPQSPRRVRFDVAGAEVLPTSSPLPKESLLPTDTSPTARSYADSSEDEAESEQIEDIDSPPAPKRISSSQALRALSRRPLEDDGTVWTTQSQDPDSLAAMDRDSDGDDSQNGRDQTQHLNNVSEPDTPGSTYNAMGVDGTKEEEDTGSDEEILDMPPLRRAGKSESATILSPVHDPTTNSIKSPTISPRSPNKPALTLESLAYTQDGEDVNMRFDDDHDDLFLFDENPGDQRGPSEEEEEDESDSDSPLSPEAEQVEVAPEVKGSEFATSPPLTIPVKPLGGPRLTKDIVGSYKGRPYTVGIVSDDIHAQAASIGALNSFVGSVHGRTGIDESDIQSFRESFKANGGNGSFNGTPKSMSERLMMEDLWEAEEREEQQEISKENLKKKSEET